MSSQKTPIDKDVLTKDIAKGGVTSVRPAWSGSVATGMTPMRLARILQGIENGDMADYLTLAQDMEERDPHYASVLGVRKRSVSGVVPTVLAASDAALDVKIADDVRENLAQHDGFPDLIEDMLDALGKGFSQVELIWGYSKNRWWIDRFAWRDPMFFTFDRETGQDIRLLDDLDAVNGLPLDPNKWISHRAKLKSGHPIRGGLARLVAFGWICKAYTMKDWMAFVETYGLPLRLGRYDKSATKEDVQTLMRAVANIGTDAAAVLPHAMQIDFQEISGGQGNDIFENLARWVDEQTSKAVLGQTMTSDNGSSMAQANVHNEVRHDIAAADARSVTATLNRDLIRPYVDLNYGVQSQYPRLVIEVEEAEDTDMILRNASRLAMLGLKIKSTELRSKLGFTDPDENDEVIGGVPVQPKQAEPKTARNRPEDTGHNGRDDLDDLIAGLEQGGIDIMGDMLESILEVLEAAETYEEAQELLKTAFPKMNITPFLEGMIQNSIQARALGDRPNG
ncbi:MAG: DUF935 domain-containing protein [Planktomarina sp.]